MRSRRCPRGGTGARCTGVRRRGRTRSGSGRRSARRRRCGRSARNEMQRSAARPAPRRAETRMHEAGRRRRGEARLRGIGARAHGSTSPWSMPMVVVLPAPLGPSSPNSWPRATFSCDPSMHGCDSACQQHAALHAGDRHGRQRAAIAGIGIGDTERTHARTHARARTYTHSHGTLTHTETHGHTGNHSQARVC